MDLDEHSTTKPHPQSPAISSANRKLHTPSQGATWGHCASTRVLLPSFPPVCKSFLFYHSKRQLNGEGWSTPRPRQI